MSELSLIDTIQLERLPGDRLELRLTSLRVEVRSGPQAGRIFEVALPRIRVGKSAENDLRIEGPGMSRRHAEFEFQPEGITVRDLDSKNGVHVGGVKVKEATVPTGTVLTLGGVELLIGISQKTRRSQVLSEEGYSGLVGRSPAMCQVYGMIRAVGPTGVSVLLQGESGTGKEAVARALHEASNRSGPLVVFDAATADPALIRSDLFGHIKGAFTGAASDRSGCFREAQGGTLFVDEIGELPLDLQPRLLRVLERREVVPMGGSSAIPVDVRLVAATHRDLPAMVREGTFREDLYHRLAVVTIALPPLRDRIEDLPLLIDHLRQATGSQGVAFTEAALQAMRAHSWQGNVRALRNVVQRVHALCRNRSAQPEDLQLPEDVSPIATEQAAAAPAPGERLPTVAEAERELYRRALEKHSGGKAAAAAELGVPVSTFRKKVKLMGLV